MGEEEPPEERKGYFARRRERRLARKEAKLAAGAGAPATQPSATPAPPPPPPKPETRVSLELMTEIERRIDRMNAMERRRRLLERYEAKYGERLEVPSVFLPVEVVEEAPAADKGAVGPVESGAPTSVAPTAPPPRSPAGAATAPPPQPPAPSTPGAPERAPPAPAPAQAPAPATISLGEAPGPAPPKPKKPSPINLRTFWKYLWPYWRFPMRALAKYYSPEKKGVILAATIADVLIWILLALPRVVLCPIGFVASFLKKKRAAREPGPPSPAATD